MGFLHVRVVMAGCSQGEPMRIESADPPASEGERADEADRARQEDNIARFLTCLAEPTCVHRFAYARDEPSFDEVLTSIPKQKPRLFNGQ